MSEQPSLAGKPPLVLNKTLFVLTMLALVASACTLIGIPFSIAGLIYVVYARKQATALLGDMAQSATVIALNEEKDEVRRRMTEQRKQFFQRQGSVSLSRLTGTDYGRAMGRSPAAWRIGSASPWRWAPWRCSLPGTTAPPQR